jgi:hypothetical protein
MDNDIDYDDLTDAHAAVRRRLRAVLDEAYSNEQAATVARLLARRALDEAIERMNTIERRLTAERHARVATGKNG